MLYTIGELMFRVGIAVTIAYFVVYTLAVASGLPVPRELYESHALVSALQGNLRGLTGVLGISAGAALGIGVISALLSYFTGRTLNLEVLRLQGLVVFISLYMVAYSGVIALTSVMASFIAWSAPPLLGAATAVMFIINIIAGIALTYYVAVKVLGIPTF
ncbi:MAG: hypothetical protein QW794_04325 [Thermosphaera sp.]